MTAARLVVWRHGRTGWNYTDRFQGQTDIPLDEVGLRQAEAAAARLAALRPAALVASDLQRAAQTAAALARLTGLEVSYDTDLREIHVGSWAGMTKVEFAARHPDLHARMEAGEDVRRGGDGETVAEVAERAEKAFRRATELVADGETVVVASHGLATRVGVARLVGLAPAHWDAFGGLSNCSWVVCEPGRRGWRIVEWNAGTLPEPVLSDDR
ncbi:probable phosphoglycerate mutase [Actinopolymorpha cephalotaxi]|uniref:Phosphoglycerate mutase n=1 Tax=Actinopolymorpha cephalotaxi TaxID=504797 RepID=A0A1I2ZJW3_9ACTN|nr:histidine phosphatase family protein [Actinopolymorpha cephalotaxi]NYH82027.1 putative phosphoglycerate mutase [Actinopolymorpha cephalotaxi]SFH37876.1 probable phosphoglycerate mutase [Actinopolymorpha cephalotaxi]